MPAPNRPRPRTAPPRLSTSSPATALRPPDAMDPRVWRISSVVILGSIMSILDMTIVNVALATLGHELNAGISQIQWVVTGYTLAIASVIPVAGWAARRFSPKRVYIVSLILFTL